MRRCFRYFIDWVRISKVPLYSYWLTCGCGYLLMVVKTFKTDGQLQYGKKGGWFIFRYQNLSFQNSSRFYPFASHQYTRSPLIYGLHMPITLPKQNLHALVIHNPSSPLSKSFHTNPQPPDPKKPSPSILLTPKENHLPAGRLATHHPPSNLLNRCPPSHLTRHFQYLFSPSTSASSQS